MRARIRLRPQTPMGTNSRSQGLSYSLAPTRDTALTHLCVPGVPGISSTCSLCDFPTHQAQHLQTLPQRPAVVPVIDLKATWFPLGFYLHESQNASAESDRHACACALNNVGDVIKHTHTDTIVQVGTGSDGAHTTTPTPTMIHSHGVLLTPPP